MKYFLMGFAVWLFFLVVFMRCLHYVTRPTPEPDYDKSKRTTQ